MNRKEKKTAGFGLCLLVLCLALSGCGASSGTSSGTATSQTKAASGGAFPATDEGAKSLLAQFVKPGADYAALSRNLRPAKADYEAVFEPEMAAKADALYSPAWEAGQLVVTPKTGQTEVMLGSATTDEMKAWTGSAADFPEGWRQVAPQLKPGVKIYRFKFVEPGKDTGMAFEGLAHVNGNWRIFPKPWRAMN